RSLGSIQAVEVAHGAEGVDLSAMHDRSRPRSARIEDLVKAIVLLLPQQLAVGFLEAEDAFFSLQPFLAEALLPLGGFVALAVHDVDSAFRDRRPGKAAADLFSPDFLRPAFGELI